MVRKCLARELSLVIFFMIAIFMRFPGKYWLIYKDILLLLLVGYVFFLRYRIYVLEQCCPPQKPEPLSSAETESGRIQE